MQANISMPNISLIVVMLSPMFELINNAYNILTSKPITTMMDNLMEILFLFIYLLFLFILEKLFLSSARVNDLYSGWALPATFSFQNNNSYYYFSYTLTL